MPPSRYQQEMRIDLVDEGDSSVCLYKHRSCRFQGGRLLRCSPWRRTLTRPTLMRQEFLLEYQSMCDLSQRRKRNLCPAMDWIRGNDPTVTVPRGGCELINLGAELFAWLGNLMHDDPSKATAQCCL